MKNIYERINDVRKKVEYIKKDITLGSGKFAYSAISHDMVTAQLRKAMIEAGIIIVPTLHHVVPPEIRDTGTTTSGGVPIILYSATYSVRFVNMENPDDAVTVLVNAHANDHGDKAPGKALSYAVKYAMLKVFSLETGEDDESRIEGELAKITEDQVKQLVEVCDQYGWPVEETLVSLASTFKLDDISDLPEVWFDDAVQRMHARAEKIKIAKAEETKKAGGKENGDG